MKKNLFITACLLILLFGPVVNADILPPDSHRVTSCSKIVNVDGFPDTVFVGAVYGPNGQDEGGLGKNYIISSDECLNTGGKAGSFFYGFAVFGIEKNYYDDLIKNGTLDSEIDKMVHNNGTNSRIARADWENGWIASDTSFDQGQTGSTVEISIIGFLGPKLLIYESKTIDEFTDAAPRVKTFPKPGSDNVKLSWNEGISNNSLDKKTVDDQVVPDMSPRTILTSIVCFFAKIFGKACR